MKERLIIISDLWGKEKSQWLNHYTQILETKFDLAFYDSCEIGEVDKSNYTQGDLHKQFVSGGIEKAVEKLIELEKSPVHILAFSVGGVIAWKFGLRTNNVKSLKCVSSTRLRKETKRPNGKIKLYFGENDEHRPKSEWIENMKLESKLIEGKGHQVYIEADFAQMVCERIVKQNHNTI
ncbi:alpha/beta hydrolase [Marinifilum caeruleilacunae]|uniref:Alpha/beta hydrolase n=1 Tax=Marinifilum caeruleilacunae TaxID=2499076 RepID=A0ABX1WRX9_9BACT|nr:alpha/beta hydrolase [Marinifilum caeruleilacunae]NOU58684.1 alpha/beta hydrolase [Marinifilum caeruleilacunae]